MLAYRPKAVFVDSIQGLFGANGPIQPMTEFVETLKQYAIELKAPIIVVSHINKEGLFAGAEAIQHAVDCVVALSADDTGYRTLWTEKNRDGPAQISTVLRMTEEGLEKAELPDPDEDDSD